MNRGKWILLLLPFSLWTRTAWGDALGDEAAFAIVIGNNAAPVGTHLAPLQYADDDAVRYYYFFSQFADETHLLTVPDVRTQKRYPAIAKVASVPTKETFYSTISRIQQKISSAKTMGKKTVFYIAFSGHGALDDQGNPYLSLHDGALTREALFELTFELGADFQHMFVDACYAEGLVESRGFFDNEVEGQRVNLSEESLEEKHLNENPNLGIVLASSEHQKTHEWSQIESGVFSHEVLSGLSGAADVNLDGKIAYSELVAFITSANRGVKDERGKIKVVANPPKRDLNVPLVDLMSFKDVAYLVGNPAKLGHFSIDLDQGVRYLDANLRGMDRMHIAIPKGQRVFLSIKDREAKIDVEDDIILLAGLSFKDKRFAMRGNIEESLQSGLFRMPFGTTYYLGYVDSSESATVPMNASPFALTADVDVNRSPTSIRLRKGFSIASIVVGVGAAAAAATFGGMALKTYSDAKDATQREGEQLAKDYKARNRMFWITAPMVPVAGLAAWLLWPKRLGNGRLHVGADVSPDTQGVWLKGRF